MSHENVNKELLIRAKELISDPDHWTKGAYVRDGVRSTLTHGDVDPEKCQMCSIGALIYAVGEKFKVGSRTIFSTTGLPVRAYAALQQARGLLDDCLPERTNPGALDLDTVALFNDSSYTTHADVMALFDCAIANSEVTQETRP